MPAMNSIGAIRETLDAWRAAVRQASPDDPTTHDAVRRARLAYAAEATRQHDRYACVERTRGPRAVSR
jgi:hypothetical protein